MKELSARADLVRKIVDAIHQVEGVESPGQVVASAFKAKAELQNLVLSRKKESVS